MSLIGRISSALLILAAMSAVGRAQLFTDQGLLSGSGLMLIPSTATAPVAEFGIRTARVEFLRPGERGMNVVGFTGGFSSHVEGFFRVSGEQIGMPSSVISYGIGAKIRSPFAIPVAEQWALWMESSSTEQEKQHSIYPPNVFRGGLVMSFGTNGINPLAIAGFTAANGSSNVLAGGGVTVAASHDAQLGAEVLYGYTGGSSVHMVMSAALRVVPHVSVHVMPGYMTSTVASTWFLSIGISCSTGDIDYHPARTTTDEEYILPSIDDLERQMQGEKKDE